MTYENQIAAPRIDLKTVALSTLLLVTETACSSGSSYEVQPQPSQKQMEKITNGVRFLINGPDWKQKVINNTAAAVVYRNGSSTYIFYLAKDAPIPSQQALDKMWNYIASEGLGGPLLRFKPPKSAQFLSEISMMPPRSQCQRHFSYLTG